MGIANLQRDPDVFKYSIFTLALDSQEGAVQLINMGDIMLMEDSLKLPKGHQEELEGGLVRKLNLFNLSSVSPPFNLLFRPQLYSSYDHLTRTISYFESEEQINEERVSFIMLRTYADPILDCFDPKSSSKDDIAAIKGLPISQTLSFNLITRSNFLYDIMRHKKTVVIDALLTVLDLLPPREVPFLFPEVCVEGKLDTAFDCAFSLEQPRDTVQRMLNLMLKLDETGVLYSETIERNMKRLIATEVDLSLYFSSKMAVYEIPYSSEGYP